jgi:Xaa-Pro aminopeptidase
VPGKLIKEEKMQQENYDKLNSYLKAQGFEAALIASPFNITWLTGYAPAIQTGPSPFEGGPALGWFRAGQLTLLVNDWDAGAVEATGVKVQPYTGYTVEEPLACTQRMASALKEMLKQEAGLSGSVGVEMNSLPAALHKQLEESLPHASLVNLDQQLDPLRAVKTAGEIEKLRAALRLSDMAQEAMRLAILPGVTELELYEKIKAKVEYEVGGRVPVLLDLVAGVRTADIGGPPSNYTLQPGDPVMLDFVPRLDGYWGDNCAGYFVGEPSTELEKVYKVVKGSLYAGRDAIRPGLKAEALDALVRKYIRDAGYEPYPHHTGHGLGTIYHEEPRIVPNHPMELEPGMVLVLEPGIYLAGVGGVRLEDAYLVTSDGCEVLTTHLID